MEKIQLHRISKTDEEKLLAAFREKTEIRETDSPEAAAEKREYTEKMQSFREKYALIGNQDKSRRLCYEMLGDFLKSAGMSYRDLFEITAGQNGERRELHWTTEAEKDFAAYLENLSEDGKRKLLAEVRSICPKKLRDLTERREAEPAEKLYTASFWRAYCKEDNYNIAMEISNVDKYRMRGRKYSYNSTELGRMPDLSEAYHVSLHWLLQLGPEDAVLCSDGISEQIMDYYCLCPEWVQNILADGLKKTVEGEQGR